MRADGHAGVDHLLGDLRMPGGVLADLEEGRLQTFVGQRLEHGRRVPRPGTIVEGQDDFLVAEEVILLEMLKAEAGTADGIDLDDPREPHAAGLVAGRNGSGGGLTLSGCVRRWRIGIGCRRSLHRLHLASRFRCTVGAGLGALAHRIDGRAPRSR
jgi:hypothetical protein